MNEQVKEILPLSRLYHDYLLHACMEGQPWHVVASRINPQGTTVNAKFVEHYFTERADNWEKNQRYEALRKREMILELHVQGMVFDAIAKAVGGLDYLALVKQVIEQITAEERHAAIMRVKNKGKRR